MSEPKVNLSSSKNRDPVVTEIRLRSTDYLGASSREFIQAMLDRLGFGATRYGCPPPEYFAEHDMAASAILRILGFLETRDPEMLIDAANFALLEFLCGTDHMPSGMWTGEHSPGIIARAGQIITKARGCFAGTNGQTMALETRSPVLPDTTTLIAELARRHRNSMALLNKDHDLEPSSDGRYHC